MFFCISGRQLLAEAEVNDRNRILEENTESAPKTKKMKFEWREIEGNFEPNIHEFRCDTPEIEEFTDMFESFHSIVDDEVVELLRRYTNTYAMQKGIVLDASFEEMYVFLAIHYFSGYHQLPYKELYWNTSEDCDTKLIRKSMSRNRFRLINKCLHMSNNENLARDNKFAKVLPISNILRQKFRKYSKPEQNISVDEAMIRYYGRHGCKQFVKGKPIRFGFKVWSCNNVDGYLLDFEFYQGATGGTGTRQEFGLGASVVIDLVDRLPGRGYHVFCDRFFTGLPMIQCLSEKGISVTGTIQKNRLRDCPLKDKHLQNRGDHEECITESKILVLKWQDNAEVFLASSASSVHPVSTASRYSVKEKRRIDIQQPFIVKQYNKNMGGTDLMDNHVNTYRISIRGKKWWNCIFSWLFDVAMSNAWLMYRRNHSTISQLSFRRQVVRDLFLKYGANKVVSSDSGRRKVPMSSRFDGNHHWIVSVPSQLRCALPQCLSRPKSKCEKCNVGLCLKCFKQYHCPL